MVKSDYELKIQKQHSHSRKHIRKHIRRNTFQFLIQSAKNQRKELRKSYSLKKYCKMWNSKQTKPPKLSCVWSKNSISETDFSIVDTNFYYIPIIFLNLTSNTKSALYFFAIPVKKIRQRFQICKIYSSPKLEFRVKNSIAWLAFRISLNIFNSYGQ